MTTNEETPESGETPQMVEVLAEEFYLAVSNATRDHWLLWENVPWDERSGYYDLAYEVAEKIGLRGPDCAETCAPHLHQHCSPECETACGCGLKTMIEWSVVRPDGVRYISRSGMSKDDALGYHRAFGGSLQWARIGVNRGPWNVTTPPGEGA